MLELLCSGPEGRVLLCNIIDALLDASIGPATVAKLLDDCLATHCARPAQTVAELVQRFADSALQVPGPAGSPNLLLACPTPLNGPCQDAPVSTVLEFGTLDTYFLDSSVVKRGHGVALAHPDPGDPALGDAITDLSGHPDAFLDNARFGGGPRPLFWVTPTRQLFEGRPMSPGLAEDARDVLGLIHFGTGDILVEMQLPAGTTAGHRGARPTFADAGTHARFRHRPDASPGRCGPGWGMTVALHLLAARDVNIDGSPERVMAPLMLKDAGMLNLRPLGAVPTDRGDTLADDHGAFAECLHPGEDRDALIDRLMKLI
ncbi:hypothetical protein [uncultured Thiodictyon sp.]|jgi:hypothetical protein|uniref:hypothetical protein n=1 Tax=uncultured Thiodictyon sp. TaxID=1846217 RepID=UPI0025E06B12|nr:hypothetical protein [uncultured Thiodictyon sp.]